ncbi:hypothetical protein PR048_013341 [Dryococelus australis]|uniref:PiggyBac transposable element-derived protein domain-containing protein n=1 Tax=Dryococelus australis TaxID=614101 RepID=A0ABQ9HS25_9NEOP|nr:hypothetical protein PR048_013341 [Dryococelus australis]
MKCWITFSHFPMWKCTYKINQMKANDDVQDLSLNSVASDVGSSLLENLDREEIVLQGMASRMLASDTVTFLPSPTAELFPELSVLSPTSAFHDKISKVNANDSESRSVAGTSTVPVSSNQTHEAHSFNMCVESLTPSTAEKQSPALFTCPKLRLAEVVSDGSGWNNSTDEMTAHQIIPEIPPRSNKTFSKTSKEINFFSVIIECDTIPHIVKQTHLYASQDHHYGNDNSKPRKIQNWVDTSSEEIRAFFAILIIMGIHQRPHLCNYWSTDPIVGVESDKSLVKSLNENRSKTYHHSNRLSVDESMIPFIGRSGLKQYMPMKPVKRGYKVWCLADYDKGFVLKFEIYSGKTGISDDLGPSERVVLYICSQLMDSQTITQINGDTALK